MTSSVAGRDLRRPLLGLSVVPFQFGLYSLHSQGAGPRVQFRQGGHPQQQFRADLPRHFLYSHHPCKGKIKNLLECGYNQSDYRRVRQGGRRPVGSEYHQNTISECRGSRTATRLLTFGCMEYNKGAQAKFIWSIMTLRECCPSGRRRDEGSRWESGAIPVAVCA